MLDSFVRFAALSCLLLLGLGAGLARADARGDLLAAYQKMLDSRFASETVSTDQGKQSKVEARYDTIQRVHMKTPQMELILLPEGTWMKSGDEWTKPPFDIGGMVKSLLPLSLEQARAGITNVKDEGMASVDGQSLRAISYDQNMTVMGISVSSRNKAFLNTAGQIVRSEGEGEAMGHKSAHVQTIRYDDSIRVTAPK